jgi:hypothetical protein
VKVDGYNQSKQLPFVILCTFALGISTVYWMEGIFEQDLLWKLMPMAEEFYLLVREL